MKNKFRIGEIVLIKTKNKKSNKTVRSFGIIEAKDYYFNEYLVSILSESRTEWFKEKNIEILMERKYKKKNKYKVVIAINKKGLKIILDKVNHLPNKHNNIFQKVDIYKEYKANKNEYAILVWTSTYWSENNFAVRCIQKSLKQLQKENIAYKQIIIGETDPSYYQINEFIANDKYVDIFNVFHKIEIKNVGGILV